MILTTTNQKIEAVLAGSVSANQPQFVVSYADITSTAFTPGSNNGDLNGTTEVDLVTAPGASTYRQIKHLSIHNTDTAAVTVTVNLDDGGTDRKLIETTLPAGSVLSWSPETGWVKGVSGSHSFIDMPDAPGSYSGNAGKAVAVNSGEDAVEFVTMVNSVFGRTGTVTSQSGDYNAGQIDETASAKIMTGAERTKLSGIESGAEVNDVDSVFGRTGAVTAQSGDYNFLQLGDVPGNYTGDANKVPQVNSGETALEFTDTLLMGDGTEANPAFSFASDPDTGMFSPAANTLGLATGGVERWRVSNAGRLISGSAGAGSPVGSSDGITLFNVGSFGVARTDSTTGFFARRNTDGEVITFRKDTANKGFIEVDGTGIAVQGSGEIRFKIGASEEGQFNSSGLFIGDTANANMTRGLTINQGAADDEILAFKSSDIAHGVTDETETDTFGLIKKVSFTQGGLRIDGFSEGSSAFISRSVASSVNTGKTTGSIASVMFDGLLKSGTGTTTVGADGNLFAIRDENNTRLIVDAEGDIHVDGSSSLTTFDEHDDVALLSGLRADTMTEDNPARQELARFIGQHREVLESTGVVAYNEDGHHFVSMKGMMFLTIDAVRQVHDRAQGRIAALEERVNQLQA